MCRWTLGMKGKRRKSLRTRPRTADASEMKDGMLSREERLRSFRLSNMGLKISGFKRWSCELDILAMMIGLLQNQQQQDCKVSGAGMLRAGTLHSSGSHIWPAEWPTGVFVDLMRCCVYFAGSASAVLYETWRAFLEERRISARQLRELQEAATIFLQVSLFLGAPIDFKFCTSSLKLSFIISFIQTQKNHSELCQWRALHANNMMYYVLRQGSEQPLQCRND